MTPTTLDLCLAVQRAEASLRLKLDDELGRHHGIDFGDLGLLHCLQQQPQGAAPLSALVRPLGQQRSAVLRRLIALEKIGLVDRQLVAGGRVVALRPAGRALVGAALRTADEATADAFAAVSSAQMAPLFAAMQTLAATPALDPR